MNETKNKLRGHLIIQASFSLFICTSKRFLDSLVYVATMLDDELSSRTSSVFSRQTKNYGLFLIARIYSNRHKPIYVSSGVNTGQNSGSNDLAFT